MEYNWSIISQKLKRQVSESIYTVDKSFDIDGSLETLFKILNLKIDDFFDTDISGLNESVLKRLDEIYVQEDFSRDNLNLLLNEIESFLKKTLYLVSPQLYKDTVSEKKVTLGTCINALKLNPSEIKSDCICSRAAGPPPCGGGSLFQL